MRVCVIFNPAAKSEKAISFRRHFDRVAAESRLKLTAAPGDGRRLATEAVTEGFETIVAAGGDGTLNEVLNGLGDAPDGFERARLAVLPLGTVNVFARELAIPVSPDRAWEIIRQGQERRIDLPSVSYLNKGAAERRYFVQLAGAGLDARAVELVAWETKKKLGVMAYILAGLRALAEAPARISASSGSRNLEGGLVLIGNGRFYGGSFRIFPRADLADGLLEVCVFPRVNWLTLARCGPRLLLKGDLPASVAQVSRTQTLQLTSAERVPFQVDGELAGNLPATFAVEPRRLRVVVPDLGQSEEPGLIGRTLR